MLDEDLWPTTDSSYPPVSSSPVPTEYFIIGVLDLLFLIGCFMFISILFVLAIYCLLAKKCPCSKPCNGKQPRLDEQSRNSSWTRPTRQNRVAYISSRIPDTFVLSNTQPYVGIGLEFPQYEFETSTGIEGIDDCLPAYEFAQLEKYEPPPSYQTAVESSQIKIYSVNGTTSPAVTGPPAYEE